MSGSLREQLTERLTEVPALSDMFTNDHNRERFLNRGYILYVRVTSPDTADVGLLSQESCVPFSEIDESA